VAEHAVHVGEYTGRDEGGERVGDEVTTEQDGVTEGELPTGVPLPPVSAAQAAVETTRRIDAYLGQDEEGTREESSLNETQAKTSGHHSPKAGHDARERRDHAPKKHGDANVDTGSGYPVYDHVARHLHQDVPNVEDTEACRVVGVAELQVGLETLFRSASIRSKAVSPSHTHLETGSRDVVPVKVVCGGQSGWFTRTSQRRTEDVDDDEKGASRIELALEALLDLGPVRLGLLRDLELGVGLDVDVASLSARSYNLLVCFDGHDVEIERVVDVDVSVEVVMFVLVANLPGAVGQKRRQMWIEGGRRLPPLSTPSLYL
jgi:hypothetical protein